jgi:hypothetical protein
MTLGKRCDEIVRLIDETLADFAVALGDSPSDTPAPGTDPGTAPDSAPSAPPLPGRSRRQWRWVPPEPGAPEREAAGF